MRLLDAIEQYGYGNWVDIAKHIERRTPDGEQRDGCRDAEGHLWPVGEGAVDWVELNLGWVASWHEHVSGDGTLSVTFH